MLSEQVKTDIREFISINLASWQKELDWIGEANDGDRSMDITFATNDDGSAWNYQTGDNSYTGGAYGLPHWAVTSIVDDTTVDSLFNEIIDELEELLVD